MCNRPRLVGKLEQDLTDFSLCSDRNHSYVLKKKRPFRTLSSVFHEELKRQFLKLGINWIRCVIRNQLNTDKAELNQQDEYMLDNCHILARHAQLLRQYRDSNRNNFMYPNVFPAGRSQNYTGVVVNSNNGRRNKTFPRGLIFPRTMRDGYYLRDE